VTQSFYFANFFLHVYIFVVCCYRPRVFLFVQIIFYHIAEVERQASDIATRVI